MVECGQITAFPVGIAANEIDDVPSGLSRPKVIEGTSIGMRVTKLQVVKDTPSYSACPHSDETGSFKIDVLSMVFVGDS